MNELGLRLKKLRNKHHITQKDLSISIDVSIQTINKWEKNKRLPDAINIKKISEFYNISADIILNIKCDCSHKNED